ncbi:AraC family transcriptional regulator [Amycolatopsis jejuensis]|uniref:AraC family transcriptional regulator n=1 Tax=Amycolatopsis jejuensis TaxID=330084 RepID=UPI000689B94A|nr:AraC family transcriptional regulator [Amycolatopsis jejuensis]
MTESFTLLRRHEVFRSRDPDQFREQVARIFCPHDLVLYGRGARLNAYLRSKRLRNLAINLVAYGGDVLIDPGRLDDFFVVMMPLSGNAHVRSGTEEIDSGPGLAAVPHPDRPLRMRWTADCVQLIIRIDRAALEARLRDELGYPLNDGSLAFRLGMDMTAGLTASWRRMSLMLASELDNEENLVDRDELVGSWEDMLMASLLSAQQHNYSAAPGKRVFPAAKPEVNAAIRLIKDSPGEDWSVKRLARMVDVGPRMLQQGLQAIGTTFTDELRRARLQRIHDALHAAAPGTTTVSKVFAQNGIKHHSRGAKQYRGLFGELPSETLRS